MAWLFVDGLSDWTEENAVRVYFSQWDYVKDCKIVSDEFSRPKGYAFVYFESENAVDMIQRTRPHYINHAEVTTRRMLDPYHPGQRRLDKDFSTTIYIEGFPVAASNDELLNELSFHFTVLDMTRNLPLYWNGSFYGSSTIRFADYDAVDSLLMSSEFKIRGVHCTLRSEYQQQQHSMAMAEQAMLQPLQNCTNITVVDSGGQNLGTARKRARSARSTHARAKSMHDEIDPVRGQIKRKRGLTTSSLQAAKKPRLHSDLPTDLALERDGRVHRALQAAQLLTNSQAMKRDLETEIQAMIQEEEEKRLKMDALLSVTPVGKKSGGGEVTNTDTEQSASSSASKVAPTECVVCHACAAVIGDTHSKLGSSVGERTDVADTVASLRYDVKLLEKRRKELTQDLTGLKKAVVAAEQELACRCEKGKLAFLTKCGHGVCQQCAETAKTCRICLTPFKVKIPIKCVPCA